MRQKYIQKCVQLYHCIPLMLKYLEYLNQNIYIYPIRLQFSFYLDMIPDIGEDMC